MAEILAEIYSWISFVPKITFKNLIEIAIIESLVYEVRTSDGSKVIESSLFSSRSCGKHWSRSEARTC